eukprot:GSChrysophyteH2.ASY1.ANO1.1445.1 assembled CDS
MKAGSYNTMDLDKNLLSGLNRMGYKVPTPVQRKTLPIALAGMDVVCMSRTGSGKTGAFLIPMLQKFNKHDSTAGVRGIVMSPTRELAVQTYRFCKDMVKFMDVRVASIIGGDAIEPQFEALSNRPDLMKECSGDRQTLLFSATMPRQLLQFTRAGLREPQLIRLESESKTSDELRMAFLTVRSNEKMAALLYLVRTIIPKEHMTIVFTATKHHSEYVHHLFNNIGVTSTVVYGSMDQDLRSSNLKDFRNGKISFLIVTDLAARGIDVPLLNNVINLHFPPSPKLFVHRCGRAARQGRVGYAFSLVEPEEMAYMVDVHTFLGKDVNNKFGDEDTEDTNELTFLPEFVHTGLVPQDAIDEENDFLQRALNDEEHIGTLARIASNGMQQYRRTRNEATDNGVKVAKKLVKSNAIVAIHPLICGEDPNKCKKDNVEKANFIRVLQTFRPAQTVLETGKGKKGTERGGETDGVAIMRALRKTTSDALIRNKDRKKEMYEKFLEEQANNPAAVDKSSSVSQAGDVSEMVSRKKTKKNTKNGQDNSAAGDDVWAQLEKISAEEEGRTPGSAAQDDFSEEFSAESGKLKRALSSSNSADGESGNGAFKVRMSAAERKRMKKGDNDDAATDSAEGGTLVDGYEKGSNNFADKRFYMPYGTEDDKAQFAEESLNVHSGLKTAEAQHAAMMEAAMIDVNPDDATAMNNKRRIMRWDAKKRKYVKQSLTEIANLKGSNKSRSENGSGNGKKSSKPVGDMYSKWSKKTHREINTFKVMADIGTDYSVGSGDNNGAVPKFKHNMDVASELKNEQQIRKEKKDHENKRIKNLPKAKRTGMENAARKKKKSAAGEAEKKGQFVHKAARKQVKAIRTGSKR